LCEEIVQGAGSAQVVNLSGSLTFLQSAALMKDAVMNFVNDSAPLHLASAVNAPVTAIFCSTVPEFGFGPLSEGSLVVETRKQLPCRPCGLHGFRECPEKHFACAMTIDNQELLNRIQHD
jgi:heptosyltransferase-2